MKRLAIAAILISAGLAAPASAQYYPAPGGINGDDWRGKRGGYVNPNRGGYGRSGDYEARRWNRYGAQVERRRGEVRAYEQQRRRRAYNYYYGGPRRGYDYGY